MIGARVVVYDRTCTGGWLPVGLTHSWRAGARMFRARGAIDEARAVGSWAEAWAWLAAVAARRGLREVQFWGHGRWGCALIGRDRLDAEALTRRGDDASNQDAVAAALAAERGRWWLRTCESFGAIRGQAFAVALSERLGCAVSGHTYVIGPLQSGLRSLAPGAEPDWDPGEGLLRGTARAPVRARWSSPAAPRTITCLHARIPAGW